MSHRYFLLQHTDVKGKSELVVIHSLVGETEEEATTRFKAWLDETGTGKQTFLVKVLGVGLMEVEMKPVFKEDGAHAN